MSYLPLLHIVNFSLFDTACPYRQVSEDTEQTIT